ncbi:MAG: hypothetical protein LBC85_04475 [Fibromonadaceae bacterium]|jgi:hypothetical protein|nr:hypothetical protein [Fibromonadaceae bacterium]
MIKSKMMSPKSSKPRGLDIRVKSGSKDGTSNKGGKGKALNSLFYIFVAAVAILVCLEFFGPPGLLRNIVPRPVAEMLGLSEASSAIATAQTSREAASPRLTAQARSDDPSIPINSSVEEVVKTVRPEIFFRNKIASEYNEQPISNRTAYQKQAFHVMLSTFYNATPDGIGYLDLAYQAPNFFFARAIALDSRTRTTYMDNLKSRVVDLAMTDSVTGRDGNVEFTVFGGVQRPNFEELKPVSLVQPSKINSEIIALRNLAALNQVRLTGLEKPVEEKIGSYRRIVLNTSTDADYPALLNFAYALQKSDIAFGVQRFLSRPAGPEKMQSALEFVLYASAK